MKFRILFDSIDFSSVKLLYGLTDDYGVDFIENLKREYPELKNIHIKNIEVRTSCPVDHYESYRIEIDNFETIQKIPHFKRRNFVNVKINKDGFLGQFLTTDITINRKRHGFKLLKTAEIRFILDDEAILNKWIDDGCPLEWPYIKHPRVHKYEITFTDRSRKSIIVTGTDFTRAILNALDHEIIRRRKSTTSCIYNLSFLSGIKDIRLLENVRASNSKTK